MSSIEPTEPAAPRARLNRVRVALWGAAALAAGAGAFALLDKPKPQPGNAESYASAIGGPFAMIDQRGRPVTDKTLRGRPFAIFFGFTRCPDVCPTTLSRMAQLRKELGSAGDKFDIVFVSVDPEHDKPADIGTYLTLFETPIIGLSGNAAQLAQIVKAYHVYYEKVPQPGGNYTIDHSASVFLMGRKGEFVTTIDGHEGQAPALAKLRRLIDG
ncbi:SCO family protein [Sphingomonas sp. QA11]|uniref:SCO family protein n=1 Tax=Sphingomonas sp. QA11 TaxID=2950605 RepID=UPI00234A9A64|nr:SCO family protein [Sphingomonas sp. QA11]WCM28109.1 SCO family protein [Sphingomonas sp. QA11]